MNITIYYKYDTFNFMLIFLFLFHSFRRESPDVELHENGRTKESSANYDMNEL